MADQFNKVSIGGGHAGYVAAIRATQLRFKKEAAADVLGEAIYI